MFQKPQYHFDFVFDLSDLSAGLSALRQALGSMFSLEQQIINSWIPGPSLWLFLFFLLDKHRGHSAQGLQWDIMYEI